MRRIFARSPRRQTADAPTWRTWTGLLLLPVLVMGLFLWAFWSPDTKHGAARAVVVNDDEPVTINGRLLPLGRVLAAELIANDASYTWTLTDAKDARDGLARGDYGAAVFIPPDFSANATSAVGDKPLEARQAEIKVQTSNATGVADPLLSSQIAKLVLRNLNQQIVEAHLDEVYVSFGTVHDELNKAVDGANRLADGADRLGDGATQLSSGTAQLAAGLNRARNQVNAAHQAVLDAIRSLETWLREQTGWQFEFPPELLNRLQQFVDKVNSAANGAERLHDGTLKLVDGLGQLRDGAGELASGLAQGRDKIPDYDEAERDRLVDAAATPAIAVTNDTNFEAAVAAVGLSLALWSCAFAVYVSISPAPHNVLASRRSTLRIVGSAVAPGAAVGLVSAVVLSAILFPLLDLPVSRWILLLGVVALCALTFVALNQAAMAILGRVGRSASITVLVLAIVTSVTSSIPTTLNAIGGQLPTHSAVTALRGVITGAQTTTSGVIQLIAWMTVAALATLVVTERRRLLSSRQLRLPQAAPVAVPRKLATDAEKPVDAEPTVS